MSMWHDLAHGLLLPPSTAAGTFSPRDWLNTSGTPVPAPAPAAAGRLGPGPGCDTDYFADWSFLSAPPIRSDLPGLVAKAVARPPHAEPVAPTMFPSLNRGQAGVPWYLQAQQDQYPFPVPLPTGPSTLPPTRSYGNSPSISPSALQSQSSTPPQASTAVPPAHLPSLPCSPSPTRSPRPSSKPRQSSRNGPSKAKKRRASSADTTSDRPDTEHENELEHEDEHEHEIPESVERDGMIWGMRVDFYRALGARDRKKVRNRISARTFRAKRKEHLSSMESTLDAKDRQIKSAQDEVVRLRAEVSTLERKLAQYGA